MGNWRHIFKNFLLGIVLLVSAGIYAQEEKLARAGQLYREKNYERAALVIDSAIKDTRTSDDFIAWTQRAFIYYFIYIKTDKVKLDSPLRDTVLVSIRKSVALNPDSDYIANNNRLLVNLAAHYFNISKSLLQDSISNDRSLLAYSRYKDLLRLTGTNQNVNSKDVEYYLAVGSVFSDVFNKDNNNNKAQNTAKVALMKVLEVQPDNPAANMNLGLMYYNQAANLSKSLEYGADFEQIDFVQENIVKLARQSEQFIYKVYSKDNKNRKACTALYYIYRMLLDYQKSDEFKKKAENLGEKFTEDSTVQEGNINDKPDEK